VPSEAADDRPSVPLSALEHYAYCPRQAALIHVDGYFQSNVDTVRGDLAHSAVNQPGAGSDRRRHRVWRSLPVWNRRLGIHGVCDVVEFDPDGRPTPVEHKSGSYRPGGPADLQAGAQALCLEEMFDVPVPEAVVFAGRDRRRYVVTVDHRLVSRIAEAADGVRKLLASDSLPAPVNDRRCARCSLRDGCMPDVPAGRDLFHPRPVGSWRD
jgi:CRISPR-associated exonuclease Cas4